VQQNAAIQSKAVHLDPCDQHRKRIQNLLVENIILLSPFFEIRDKRSRMASHRLLAGRRKKKQYIYIFEENFNREKHGSNIRNAWLSLKRSLFRKWDV
jgi:hypothetical protein